jgi:glucose/arabinose dehydrogenase
MTLCTHRLDSSLNEIGASSVEAAVAAKSRHGCRASIVEALLLTAALSLGGCGEATRLPAQADAGRQPQLTAPVKTLLPTVNIAWADKWPQGTGPQAATGLQVVAFAQDLDHPRWLLVLPNGDVLVAETNAPPRPKEAAGPKGWAMQVVMGLAGATVPSANRITLLRDTDRDGRADLRSVLAEGLNSPFGMAFVAAPEGPRLYVANTDGVLEFAWRDGMTRLDAPLRLVAELPAGDRNHHWTKTLVASPDGSKLYVGVGSNSNVAEHGMGEEAGRAAVWEIDRLSGKTRLYATGMRNPVGLAWLPDPQAQPRLWGVVQERDEIGSDLVPDYLTSVAENGFYGWPYSWWGNHVDERVDPGDRQAVNRARLPDYALGAHVAALGLAPGRLGDRDGVYVGLHGSWNRRPLSGYKVVFVPFEAGMPAGLPQDVLTGFVSNGKARGRPAGVAVDARGALLVADDVGNTVWRVSSF